MDKLSSPPGTAVVSNMDHAIVIDNDLDKECSALGGLFQQIVNEMKVSRNRKTGFK